MFPCYQASSARHFRILHCKELILRRQDAMSWQIIFGASHAPPTMRFKDLCFLKVTVSFCRDALPRVKHLGIACQQLRVCPTCMPWQETTLDLQFQQADEDTMLHLTSSQELTVNWGILDLDHRRAVKLDNAACDFRSELASRSRPRWPCLGS